MDRRKLAEAVGSLLFSKLLAGTRNEYEVGAP